MNFIEKNEENLEAMVFALTQRNKTTIAIAIYDHESSRENAIAYLNKNLEYKTSTFDLFGQKPTSLLGFLRQNLPSHTLAVSGVSELVHLTRLDPLLFVSENHKVKSSPLVAQINMERELLFHEIKAILVLWVVRESYNRLRLDAPDFMDWATATFTFESVEAAATTLSFDIPKETIEDRSQAALLELKEKAADLKRRADKFDARPKLTTKDKKEALNLLIALADAYTEVHDLTNAQKTFAKAYDLAQKNQLLEGFVLGEFLVNWGDIETQLGNLEKALALFDEALQHFILTEDKFNTAVSYAKLGETHSSLGNLDKALSFFEEYNRLEKELYAAYPTNVSFKNGLAISYAKLGAFYQDKKKDTTRAKKYYEQCHVLWQELTNAFPGYVEFQNNLKWVESKLTEK